MPDSASKTQFLAILIDGDNVPASIIEGLLAEVAKLGVASVKRIYGDWTTPNLGQWKQTLLQYSIQPIQQFRYTTGKNATDSAMIIDAMDLLYMGHFSGFCLVSSDSDFTRLAARIRESGCFVYGFGEKKTPRPFVAACDRFIYTEVFAVKTETGLPAKPSPRSSLELRGDTTLLRLVREGIETASDEAGWAPLGAVGQYISRAEGDFDSRNYGYAKLSELVTAIGLFEVDRREAGVYVKDLRKK
ncbi:NYN domain-containing protein [Castellaniella sp.]|uniref:NYN domain-containing protein n=1 Tax=Castellaniella sp. TaxID=1955812 RepID=UPI00356311FB